MGTNGDLSCESQNLKDMEVNLKLRTHLNHQLFQLPSSVFPKLARLTHRSWCSFSPRSRVNDIDIDILLNNFQ